MTKGQVEFLRDFLLQRVEEIHLTAQRVLCSLPEAQRHYRPRPWSRSARELATHIVSTELMLLGGIARGQFRRGEDEDHPLALMTIADLAEYYDQQFNTTVEQVRRLSVQRLTPYLSLYGIFRHPAVVFLTFPHDHTLHHAGELNAYLREMGLEDGPVSADLPAMKYVWDRRRRSSAQRSEWIVTSDVEVDDD